MSERKASWAHRARVHVLADEATSKEERRLVQKLDFFIMTYCCFSYFFNYLDRAAFANAYVAGLSDDLALSGANYNVVLSCFTAGSVVGQIPHGIVIQKVAPRIWFPLMALVWAVLTMCTAACTSYGQLCAVRFLQGLAEASTYCGAMYIIGSWYKAREIAKRTAIFTASGQAGSMFAGLMMTAIYQGMNGYASLAGWRWVFLIDGIITLPIAVMGFLYFPDVPEATQARWLSPAERALALSRLPAHAKNNPEAHNIAPWSLFKRTMASPAIYILCVFAVVTGALEAFVVQSLFLLWMKYHKKDAPFTQAQVNTYPLGVQAVGIVSNFLAAVHIDATGRRVPMGVLVCVLQIVAAVLLLLSRRLPRGAVFFAFYLSGTSYMVNPVSFGWANIVCQRGGDDAVRSVTLYAMNAASTCLYTFWGIVLYPASDAPYWTKGCVAMIVVAVVMLGLVGVVHWLDKRTLARFPDAARSDEDVLVQDTAAAATGHEVESAGKSGGDVLVTSRQSRGGQ